MDEDVKPGDCLQKDFADLGQIHIGGQRILDVYLELVVFNFEDEEGLVYQIGVVTGDDFTILRTCYNLDKAQGAFNDALEHGLEIRK